MSTITTHGTVYSNADAATPEKKSTDWGSLLGGIASGIGAAVAKPASNTYVTNNDSGGAAKSNTGLYVGIAAGVLVIVVVIVLIVKKSKG